MQDMLKGCSTISRGKEFRNLRPFPLSPEPTKAEGELSMTCAHGEPVSPEPMHQAAVDVWMFLLMGSLNWQFEGCKVKRAESSQPTLPQTASAAQQAAFLRLMRYVDDFVRGPVVPAEDWASMLKTAKADCNGEEIKLPEAITWALIAPALSSANLIARVRAMDLSEGPIRELLRDPTTVLLPSAEWPRPVPQAKVWVALDSDWADSCKGCARMGLFTFLQPRDVFSCVGRPVPNGMFVVPKKGKLVEGTNLPILRLILNAIPSNAFQRIIEADIRALPHHGQWSGTEVDLDETVIVWSESDMTAAFCCFLLESAWYPFQAFDKTVLGALAAEFDPTLAKEPRVYPALRFMPMGWQSACGLLQYFHRRLCLLPPPLGAGLDPSREIRRDMPLPLTKDKSQQDFFTVYLDVCSQAGLLHVSGLASAAEVPSATAVVHAAWTNWGIPRQLG